MESESAIKIEGVGKMFRLYSSRHDRVKQFAASLLRRIPGIGERRYHREFWALKDVTFDIAPGETVGIVGRNGCGKSTLLQIVCGTLNLTEGSVSSRGRTAALLELGAGFNPQFTGRENVYVNAALLGFKRKEIASRIDAIADFADIGEFFDQPVRMYSSGMYVRLAFSVITHMDADVLIIDEALAVGDAPFAQKCMRFLHDFRKKGTVLFVSHDAQAVAGLCDRVVFLRNGRVDLIGNPGDVLKRYLASIYEDQQVVDGVEKEAAPADPAARAPEWRDMRADLINASSFRNDIEIFTMPPYPRNMHDFGTGDAVISSVRMVDGNGTPYAVVIGGEDVTLEIKCRASRDIENLVVGFSFKNRLGQVLFSDDTSISLNGAFVLAAGKIAKAKFSFRLPWIPAGEYSFDAMVGEMLPDRHVSHHWAHDALLLTAQSSLVRDALMKIPVRDIALTVVEQ